MKIVVTGSLGNVSKPLSEKLIDKGHEVIIVSSTPERQSAIEALGAEAAIGSVDDVAFLTETFRGADVVYLMEPPIDFFDHKADLDTHWTNVAKSYKIAVQQVGATKVIHLSSVGAHTDKGNTLFAIHYKEEQILRELPDSVSIKHMRPVGFYTNAARFFYSIKEQGAILANYDGNSIHPWVSPLDIADAIVEEIELPFQGRTFRYIASEELSGNQIAEILGEALGKPGVKWRQISDEDLVNGMVSTGMSPVVAKGFAEMQSFQGSGRLYEDYYRHKPVLGKIKFKDFAKEFAKVYHL
ncbi:NAD-dependent dehydratase [Mucilaginibacter limnophilus]|uniref:NAD-dependent dehydratase n=1 Tax=Mucilaginibacter limnophilus TaxID=1932778 RepID=A0A3S2VK27_9SPHI|nr:NmrA family NAD(P)-binding protein [Mucilaginibacter limnophilus]RVT97216.1 NAD-dependent dehydratase [Mucilaginibacter limnophilus]